MSVCWLVVCAQWAYRSLFDKYSCLKWHLWEWRVEWITSFKLILLDIPPPFINSHLPPPSCTICLFSTSLPHFHPLKFYHDLLLLHTPHPLLPIVFQSPGSLRPVHLISLFSSFSFTHPLPSFHSRTGALPPVSLWVLQLPFGPWQPRPIPQPAVWERRERAGRPARHTQLRMHQLPRWGVMNVAQWICMCISHVSVRTDHLNTCKNVCMSPMFTHSGSQESQRNGMEVWGMFRRGKSGSLI